MSEKEKGYYRNKIKYIARYNKENYKLYCLRLHKEHDKELIDYVETKDNKQGYLRELIRDDKFRKEEDI